MKDELLNIALRIREELPELDLVIERARGAWQRYQSALEAYYLDSVALNLHGLYEGMERLFDLIALSLDKSRPQGPDSHQVLLSQMQKEVTGIRPAVLSGPSGQTLDRLRRFRHIVRHVYTHEFDPDKISELMVEVESVFPHLQRELLAFADFLEQQAQETDTES